jgi:hypothetical protein
MPAKTIESLVQKWLESGDDAVFDEIQAECQKTQDRFVSEHSAVPEMYVQQRIALQTVSLSGILCVGHNMRSVHAPETEVVHV